MRKTLLFLLLSCLGAVSYAQSIKVTGRVTDAETSEPVIGASIYAKAASQGTTTDVNGNFSLTVPLGTKLTVSSIGYESQEAAAAVSLAITLKANNRTLNEVVVVGYGSQKKANLTGSVSQFKAEELTRRQVSSSSQLLQGLAPGISVWQQSGKPGADAANIRIRGQGSIFSSQAPLILVDGVVTSMDLVDPNTIESLTVLKDAASTAIYGSRASNGVILIKTKRGSGKGINVTYNAFATVQQATNIPQRATAVEHMELSNEAQRIQTGNPNAFVFRQDLIDRYKTNAPDNLEIFDTDWVKLLLTNSGVMQNHTMTLDAGNEKANIFASVSYQDQQGLIQNNSFRRLDIRLNPEFKLSEKLRLTSNLFFNQGTRIEPAGASPEFIIRQAIGLPANAPAKFGPGQYGDAGQSNRRNPLGQVESSGLFTEIIPRFMGKADLFYTPIKGLELQASYATEMWFPNAKRFQTNYDVYVPNIANRSYDFSSRFPGTNALSESYSTNIRNTFLAQATYQFVKDKHDVKLLAGFQSEEILGRSLGASRTDFVNETQPYISLGGANRDNSGSASEGSLAGAYARLNYAFADKYLLEVNGRYDASSRFSQQLNNQWGFFPAVSAGWVFSSENFASSMPWLNFGKVRLSYGLLGNENIGDRYPFAANYTSGTDYYFGALINQGFSLTEAANAGITWERSKQFNAGLDLTVLGSLNITFDYYVRTVTDMLLRRPIPNYVGLSPAFLNLGSMENRGWELSLNYRRNFGKFRFDGTAVLADVQNKVLELPGIPYLDEGLLRSAPGQPLRSYFGYQADGFFQSREDIAASPRHFFTANPGDIKYRDVNGDGQVNADDRVLIGSNFPRYEYSFNLNFGYGIFDLNLLMQGVGEKSNYISGTGAWPFFAGDFIPSLLSMHKDYWRVDNPNARFPRLTPTIGVNSTASSFWVVNSSYLRLKNINLGMTVPQKVTKKLGLASARIYVSGQNLLTFTKFWEGFDPEINDNNAQFYPLMKTYTVGLNIRF
jgi:TonB-linked SusC/RagA family outer membrane protein